MEITSEDKFFLLKLSRNALEYYFEYGNTIDIKNLKVSDALKEVRASFVTLTKHGDLRGCIGKLQALIPLFVDVVENTYSAAFRDTRFQSLLKDELSEIKIEISILDIPQRHEYDSIESLIKYLEFHKPGVIIEFGFKNATFLPQVWKQIDDASEFLSHLCQKAGLPKYSWQDGKFEVYTYGVENFEEGENI